jgi:hypothetical protein
MGTCSCWVAIVRLTPHLAVAHLSQRARVLPLHAHRVLSLLGKPGVVDDPCRNGLLFLERLDDVPRGLPPHAEVIPRTEPKEIQEPCLHPLARRPRTLLLEAARRASCDRLDALALALAEDALRVQRERLLLLAPGKVLTDPAMEKLTQPALHRVVVRTRHGWAPSTQWSIMEIANSHTPRDSGDTVRDKRHDPTRPGRATTRLKASTLAVVLTGITLMGFSLGGALVMRAAAREPRISRVVAMDVCTDAFEPGTRGFSASGLSVIAANSGQIPAPLVNAAVAAAGKTDLLTDWIIAQGKRVMGVTTAADVFKAWREYRTDDVSRLVTQDVLLMAGSKDHYIPLHMLPDQVMTLTAARSITARVFTEAESAQNHCQIGNTGLALKVIFDWLDQTGGRTFESVDR